MVPAEPRRTIARHSRAGNASGPSSFAKGNDRLLPHLTALDVAEIDAEVRAVLNDRD